VFLFVAATLHCSVPLKPCAENRHCHAVCPQHIVWLPKLTKQSSSHTHVGPDLLDNKLDKAITPYAVLFLTVVVDCNCNIACPEPHPPTSCPAQRLDSFAQPLSGAPGYLPGFPLLAGTEVSAPAASDPADTRKAVARLSQGLQLPGPGPAGRCTPNPVHAHTIGWGYNYSSTCTIGLTLTQVRNAVGCYACITLVHLEVLKFYCSTDGPSRSCSGLWGSPPKSSGSSSASEQTCIYSRRGHPAC
jgi:hypothetical protein